MKVHLSTSMGTEKERPQHYTFMTLIPTYPAAQRLCQEGGYRKMVCTGESTEVSEDKTQIPRSLTARGNGTGLELKTYRNAWFHVNDKGKRDAAANEEPSLCENGYSRMQYA